MSEVIEETNHGLLQAKAQIASIIEAIEENTDEDGELNFDAFREWAEEDALSVEVRSGWQSVGETLTADEFRIVLCTGGPHVEIQGEFNCHGEPGRYRVMYSDWFQGMACYRCETEEEDDAVEKFLSCFYFGD